MVINIFRWTNLGNSNFYEISMYFFLGECDLKLTFVNPVQSSEVQVESAQLCSILCRSVFTCHYWSWNQKTNLCVLAQVVV